MPDPVRRWPRLMCEAAGEGEVLLKHGVRIIGVGMTPMDRRDQSPDAMARRVAADALADAGVDPREVGLVVLANALGGRLCDQGCIRGQTWLRDAGLGSVGVVNVDNSCAGGSSALHLGYLATLAGESPVLVIGVEKMWTGDRASTLAGVEDGLPADERATLHAALDNPSGSVLMGLNATWVRHQVDDRGTTPEQIAATAVKARRFGSRNPLAQFRTPVTVDEVLAAPTVTGPLTRLMCSSFTDGAAAVVLRAGGARGAPRMLASVLRSGNGELEYHDRLRASADEAWKVAGVSPGDLDIVELHDATSAEELYALEALGFFAPGEAGAATAAGDTDVGGRDVCVNPSGGLVARGHPLGATGLCQVVELVQQLRGEAGERQVHRPRVAAAVNTGGIIAGDTALVGVHVLERA
jgi:acetyl-CoA acetyltransferase